MNYLNRQKRLLRLIEEKSIDGLLIRKKENINYLTGLKGADAILLISNRYQPVIITDLRYKEEYSKLKEWIKVEAGQPADIYKVVSSILLKKKIDRIGFESSGFYFSEYQRLKEGLKKGRRLIPVKGLVEILRKTKDKEELNYIKKACNDADKVMDYALKNVRPGISENRLKGMIEIYIKRNGFSGPGFDIIVASGKNASMPHATSTDKRIKTKETVILDLGIQCNGYNSDLTRTVFTGRIERTYYHIYNIVSVAQKMAIAAIRPGIEARRLDKISRQYISDRGFGKYFIHSLGHGVGLEVHEEPSISQNSQAVLEEGMVVTIEPGIYIPQWGGVRIEDTVLVTSNGCKVLTSEDGTCR